MFPFWLRLLVVVLVVVFQENVIWTRFLSQTNRFVEKDSRRFPEIRVEVEIRWHRVIGELASKM